MTTKRVKPLLWANYCHYGGEKNGLNSLKKSRKTRLNVYINGSLSTVVGDEKLTSREDLIGLLFLYIQSDENTLPKVNKVSKTEAQTFNIFDKLIGPLQFCI